MFNHQYDFEIEIPKEVITTKKHNHIFEELLENKVILGCVGYSKSGKDTIAKKFIDDYGYHRVAFADNIKIEMNKYLKKSVYNYLVELSKKNPLDLDVHPDVSDALLLEDLRTLTLDMIDFQTEDIPIKKRLRPFIIWYGEKAREINGEYYWINKAMEIDASGHNNIILSDVRRTKELDIFMQSNSFNKKSEIIFASAGVPGGFSGAKPKKYSSLLFYVNQFELTDKDVLTHECIKTANEKWLFDHTFYVDSRLPENGPYRKNSINFQVKEVANKFGISKPDKKINFPWKQTSLLDDIN